MSQADAGGSPSLSESSRNRGILTRWRELRSDVRRQLVEAGRSADAAEILCVTKTQAVDTIELLLNAGVRRFGENRVQEAKGKWPELRRSFPDVKLHLIGPLQRNKVDEAIDLFDVIETLDRPRLAEDFAKRARDGRRLPVLFVQVNTGEETQKSGIAPGDADAFLSACRVELGLPVAGLMAIPPVHEQAAPHFALLARIAARNGLERLSMGMSSDYRIALQLGATEVRIGTTIFGPRV